MRNLFRDYGKFQPKSLACNYSIYDEDAEDMGNGGGSDITDHIIDQVGTLTNTLLLRNANPVNTAILTNTPISTPNVTTSGIGGQSTNSFMTFAFLGLAALAVFAGLRYAER